MFIASKSSQRCIHETVSGQAKRQNRNIENGIYKMTIQNEQKAKRQLDNV